MFFCVFNVYNKSNTKYGFAINSVFHKYACFIINNLHGADIPSKSKEEGRGKRTLCAGRERVWRRQERKSYA